MNRSFFVNSANKILSTSLKAGDIRQMEGNGLTHDHYALGDTGWLLRVPRRNQREMSAKEYLTFQKHCYDTAAVTGVTPACAGIIPPTTEEANGALVVQYIKDTHLPFSPEDFAGAAACLGAMNSVSIIGESQYIRRPEKPFGTIWPVVEFFYDGFVKDRKELHEDTRALMEREMTSLGGKINRLTWDSGVPCGLIGNDTHLGNLLIDRGRKGWFVDLEYLSLDVPHIDAMEAWQPVTVSDTVMPDDRKQRSEFHRAWSAAANLNEHPMHEDLTVIAHRIMQMKTLNWLSYWAIEGRNQNTVPPDIRESFDRKAERCLAPAFAAKMVSEPEAFVRHSMQRSPAPR